MLDSHIIQEIHFSVIVFSLVLVERMNSKLRVHVADESGPLFYLNGV